jgi:hypothetical protein
MLITTIEGYVQVRLVGLRRRQQWHARSITTVIASLVYLAHQIMPKVKNH